MRRLDILLFVLIVGAPSSTVLAADWPQWRGPSLDGRSSETGLPTRWSKTENVVWSLPLPARSGSTPIVSDDHVFLSVSYDPEVDDRLELWAVDRNRGEVLWKRGLGGGNRLSYKQHMSSPSPVTDGQVVWVLTGTGAVEAFDFAGEKLWSRNLQEEYGKFGLNWGYASSPLLYGDALYIPVLHGMHTDEPSYLLKVDKESGETIWRIERPTEARAESPDAYTTPMVLEKDGGTEIIVVGGDVVTGHDPESGRELWRASGLNPTDSPSARLVASPLVTDDMIYASGKRGPILALRTGGRGDISKSHLAWSQDKGTDVPTPVTDGRYLYLLTDRGIATCLDAKTGELVWGPERLPQGTYSASPVLADGKIYHTNEDGLTAVLRAGPEFELLASNELDGYTLSSPAISDGQIFLRTAEALYVIGERQGAADGP